MNNPRGWSRGWISLSLGYSGLLPSQSCKPLGHSGSLMCVDLLLSSTLLVRLLFDQLHSMVDV
jgi:hypothetical protein